jgi:two-component system chemotaxis response regulator CheB
MTAPPDPELVAIGGSAGALDALIEILAGLPAAFPAPIVIVLHLPAGRPSLLEGIFADRCALAVREVDDKEPLAPGAVYLAPPGYHLLIERTRRAALSVDEPVAYSRPSIDVFLDSVGDAYGPRALAVLLSGANDDGARGLAGLRARGAITVVQDPATAPHPAMPRAALALDPGHLALSPPEISRFLSRPIASARKEYA